MNNFNLPPGCTTGDVDHNAESDSETICEECRWRPARPGYEKCTPCLRDEDRLDAWDEKRKGLR